MGVGSHAETPANSAVSQRENSMTIRIDNVTVLGTGVLGSQIAYQTAYSGFEVIAYDISDEIVNTARKRFEELAGRYEREGVKAGGGRPAAPSTRSQHT